MIVKDAFFEAAIELDLLLHNCFKDRRISWKTKPLSQWKECFKRFQKKLNDNLPKRK